MKLFIATAVIVAAIILGPLVTDWLRQPDPTEQLIDDILYGRDR